MSRYLIILAVAFLQFSCKKENPPEKIFAETWVLKTKEIWNIDHGLKFYKDGTCDVFPGYYDEDKYLRDTLTDPEEMVLHYIGNRTHYKLERDSLKLFNQTKKEWQSFGFKRQGENLWLTHDTIREKYSLVRTDISNVPDFDEVIVSSSACYGSCPHSATDIRRNGKVFYYGAYHVVHKGFYSGKMKSGLFDSISSLFKEGKYHQLKPLYISRSTDGSTASVCFLRNGRIIKSVEDNGSAPAVLAWAGQRVKYLEQRLPLHKEKIPEYLKPDFLFLSFNNKEGGLMLTQSESLLLIRELMKGKETHTAFREIFELSIDKNKHIGTDGRYFKIYLPNNATKTIDIGYNFIKDNQLSSTNTKI